MRKIIIKDLNEIAKEISEYCHNTHGDVVAVGYYETIVELFNTLIKTTDSEFVGGQLSPPEYDGYEDAYYLEYDEGEIWIDKARHEDGDGVMFIEDVAYVEEDFLEDYLETNGAKNVVVFGFSDVHDEKDNEHNPNTCLCMNDDNTGFTFCTENEFGHSKFKYKGNKKLTEDEAWKIVDEYFE